MVQQPNIPETSHGKNISAEVTQMFEVLSKNSKIDATSWEIITGVTSKISEISKIKTK